MLKIFKKNFRFFFIILITCFILIIPVSAFLLKITPKKDTKEIVVIATTTILDDAIRHLIGEVDKDEDSGYKKIESIICNDPLMGVGIDPHNYKTKLSDRSKIKKADLVVVNGLHLEAKMVEAFKLLSKDDTLFPIGDILKQKDIEQKDILQEGNSEDCDPHIWFDIDLWLKVVDELKDKLYEIIPNSDDKKQLDDNYKLFTKSLENLKQYIIKETKYLKDSKKQNNNELILVTAHDAFSYWKKFSKRHGCEFELHSIQGISTQTEANMKDIIELAEKLTNNNVKAIFTESSMPKDSLQSLKEEVDKSRNKRGLGPILIPKNAELYSDSLGKDGQETLNGCTYKHSTYVGAFLNNMKIIKKYLL
ncbi:zinc ABC transporter substrate-binding protein [Candidatus Phytoplasma ziziphi]|uniref:Zinc ABC transporter substrate-binding protein n=1 Tax=Ziziphus jujuba witches'-broom phytoplasma TaxID=135727 RepID=A0A660HLU9_ZIZJU|nr:zinc ABC transporter substrate-binding protein [Candidatus Phytoplasma ziziphi]AYJ01014.1 zinc ABC transporter substrate-binding protein [Candidatus Phytoplasma ziziphi]